MVGYPESSQRTLLHDAAYASMYPLGPAYAGSSPAAAALPYQTSYSPPAEELQGALDSHTLARSGYRAVQGLPERRTSFGLAEHYLAARTDVYSQGQQQQQQGQGHSTSTQSQPRYAHSASAHAHAPYPSHFALGSPTSPYTHPHPHSHPHLTSEGGGSLMDMHSPRSAPYPMPMRRGSMDSVSVPDPISPSSVPGLVFDGDEYDDDSESSSLPSAASELPRVSYRSEEREYGYGALEERSPERSAAGDADASSSSPVTPSDGSQQQHQGERTRPAQKKSKMHQCTICLKLFPRPSGLATHMNSHSGAKRECGLYSDPSSFLPSLSPLPSAVSVPCGSQCEGENRALTIVVLRPSLAFKCPIPTCTKSFAVRSNAKRHLRTHGIFPSSEHGSTSPSQFTVGFDTPLVSDVHEAGKLPSKLRWVPPSLSTRSNVEYLRGDAASEDSEDEYVLQQSCPLLPLPLPPVTPSASPTWSAEEQYEERNSYEQAESAPYISSQVCRTPGTAGCVLTMTRLAGLQWRSLPGPAIASPTSF